jgi:hypothetical protein
MSLSTLEGILESPTRQLLTARLSASPAIHFSFLIKLISPHDISGIVKRISRSAQAMFLRPDADKLQSHVEKLTFINE